MEDMITRDEFNLCVDHYNNLRNNNPEMVELKDNPFYYHSYDELVSANAS